MRARLAYYEDAVRRLAGLPSVTAVSAGANPPFGGGSSSSPVEVEGRDYSRKRGPSTDQRSVLPGYFAVLGAPLRAGRMFTDADDEHSELVVIISEAAARRDFPGEQAVGRRVRYQGQYRRIVGVVGDVRTTRLTRDAGPAIYTPARQYGYGSIGILIRARADIASLAPSIRSTLSAIESTVSVSSITPMPTLVARSYAEERYRTVIVMAFAVLAAILATVGLYGVTVRASRPPLTRDWDSRRSGRDTVSRDESADVRYVERSADRIGVWHSAGRVCRPANLALPVSCRAERSRIVRSRGRSARGSCAHREWTARASRGSFKSRERLECD